MKKFIFFILLVFIKNVYANWLLVEDQKSTQYFVDVESIKTNGNIRKIWTHQEYIEPQKGRKSSVLQVEVDCEKQLIHPLFLSSYKEYNLQGNSTDSDLSKKYSWSKVSKNDDIEFYSYYTFGCFYKPIKSNWNLFSNNGYYEIFLDKESLKQNGNNTSLQVYSNILGQLKDDDKLNKDMEGIKSMVYTSTFDCKNETLTMGNLFNYSEKDLKGNLLGFSLIQGSPMKPAEGNIYHDLVKSMCNLK